jgi:hypothetical protein
MPLAVTRTGRAGSEHNDSDHDGQAGRGIAVPAGGPARRRSLSQARGVTL